MPSGSYLIRCFRCDTTVCTIVFRRFRQWRCTLGDVLLLPVSQLSIHAMLATFPLWSTIATYFLFCISPSTPTVSHAPPGLGAASRAQRLPTLGRDLRERSLIFIHPITYLNSGRWRLDDVVSTGITYFNNHSGACRSGVLQPNTAPMLSLSLRSSLPSSSPSVWCVQTILSPIFSPFGRGWYRPSRMRRHHRRIV